MSDKKVMYEVICQGRKNLKTVIQESSHGGFRPGSGQKTKEFEVKGHVVTFRLTGIMCHCLDLEVERTGKSRSKLIQEAIYKLYHPMGDICL